MVVGPHLVARPGVDLNYQNASAGPTTEVRRHNKCKKGFKARSIYQQAGLMPIFGDTYATANHDNAAFGDTFDLCSPGDSRQRTGSYRSGSLPALSRPPTSYAPASPPN